MKIVQISSKSLHVPDRKITTDLWKEFMNGTDDLRTPFSWPKIYVKDQLRDDTK